MARSCTDRVRVLVPFQRPQCFSRLHLSCGSRAVDSIRHDAWSSWIAGGFMTSSALARARAAATCADDGRGLSRWASSRCSAWPAVQRAARVRGSQRAGCETASRYHVGSRVRRGQPLGAEVLLVVPTAGRNPFRGKASCLLARARSQNTATADPDVDRNTVTGLRVRRTNRPHNTPPTPSPCGWIASLCDA